MALPTIKGYQIDDQTVTRDDINTSVSGKAVIARILEQANSGVKIYSSTGADSGTGDVKLMVDTTYLDTIYLTAEADTLASVVSRGATTTQQVSVGRLTISGITTSGGRPNDFLALSTDSTNTVVRMNTDDVLSYIGGQPAGTYLTAETDPIATAKTITLTAGSGITVTGAAQTIGSNPTFTISSIASVPTLNDVLTEGNTSSIGITVGDIQAISVTLLDANMEGKSFLGTDSSGTIIATTLPTATSTVLGGVKVGTGLTIASGVLSSASYGSSSTATAIDADLLYNTGGSFYYGNSTTTNVPEAGFGTLFTGYGTSNTPQIWMPHNGSRMYYRVNNSGSGAWNEVAYLTDTTLQKVTDSGNTSTDHIAVGSSTILGWDSSFSYNAVQVGPGAGVMGNSTGNIYLASNLYYTGTAWRVAVSATQTPSYLAIGDSGINYLVGSTGAVGTTISPTSKFTIDTSGNITGNTFVKSGGTASQILTANGTIATIGTGLSLSGGVLSSTASGAVSSVSATNSTVTISPTTGVVKVGLNLAAANTWTANITAPAFYESSSRRLKKNIKTFKQNATELLKQVKVKEFDFKSTGTHHIGIIAEETDSIFSTKAHNSFDIASTLGVLIKGFQELEGRVSRLEKV